MKSFTTPIILASNSPRRKKLLEDAGFSFTVKSKNIAENYPDNLQREEIPRYLAQIKAEAFQSELKNEIVVAADTIVYHCQQVVGKPKDREHAIEILSKLSGTKHEVITGVALLSALHPIVVFHEVTEVSFAPLAAASITYYVDTFKPFDKAGAYGIQEWIGLIGVDRINGCFYNVMGLPMAKLYKELAMLQQTVAR